MGHKFAKDRPLYVDAFEDTYLNYLRTAFLIYAVFIIIIITGFDGLYVITLSIFGILMLLIAQLYYILHRELVFKTGDQVGLVLDLLYILMWFVLLFIGYLTILQLIKKILILRTSFKKHNIVYINNIYHLSFITICNVFIMISLKWTI